MTEVHDTVQGMWDRAYQVGVVVRSIDEAVPFYERLGIGPFEEGPSSHTLERRVYGEDSPETKVRGVLAKMGSIEFELLEPVKGPSVQRDFLEEHGEGVIHICAYTDDLDRDIAEMRNRGVEVISYGVISDGGKFAYFDTRAIGGLILELSEPGARWQ